MWSKSKTFAMPMFGRFMRARLFQRSVGLLMLIACLLFGDLGRFWLMTPLPLALSTSQGQTDEEEESTPLLPQNSTFEEEAKHHSGSFHFFLKPACSLLVPFVASHRIEDEDAVSFACRSVAVPPPDCVC